MDIAIQETYNLLNPWCTLRESEMGVPFRCDQNSSTTNTRLDLASRAYRVRCSTPLHRWCWSHTTSTSRGTNQRSAVHRNDRMEPTDIRTRQFELKASMESIQILLKRKWLLLRLQAVLTMFCYDHTRLQSNPHVLLSTQDALTLMLRCRLACRELSNIVGLTLTASVIWAVLFVWPSWPDLRFYSDSKP